LEKCFLFLYLYILPVVPSLLGSLSMLLIGVLKIVKAFSVFLMGYGASGPKDSYASY
jgi:hypothetical protein